MTRRTLLVHAWVQTALWAAIALVSVHLGQAVFARIDLTEDQRFTLSQAARRSVEGLDRPLLAQVYFTEGLQAPYHDHERALLDLLSELSAWSGGRLEVRVTDPTGDPEAMADAQRFGVRPIAYSFRAFDRTEARKVFMGLSLVYGDRQSAVDALPSIEQMEVEVVRAIRAVTTEPEDRVRIGILVGHGAPDLGSFTAPHPLARLRDDLARRGPLVALAIGEEPIPDDVDAVLVLAPHQDVGPRVRFALDQFAMRGGAIGWFLSGVTPDFQRLVLREVPHGLHALLGHYGVRLNRDVVLDRRDNEALVVPVEPGGALVRTSYPLAVATTNLERRYRPVRDLGRAVLPFATSLGVEPGADDAVVADVWIRSGAGSVSTRTLTSIQPSALRAPGPHEEPGPFALAVALSGRFPSFYAERGAPEGVEAGELLTSSAPTRMVVVSSGDAVANSTDLVLNAVDWLVADATLIDIRARGGPQAVLSPPEAVWRTRAGIAVPPLALIGLLALVAFARGRR